MMENENNNIESWMSKQEFLLESDKGDELHGSMTESFSWISDEYFEVINRESESGKEITKKDIYKANLSDIEKELDKWSIAYKIFNKLKQQWLKIFINPKTDISRTEKWFNIIWWLWPITQQTRDTMWEYDDSADSPDDKLYINKLVHEIWHCLSNYVSDEGNELFKLLFSIRSQNISITKLWNIDRYGDIRIKASEDTVEFARMYMQNPDKFKVYLWQIFKSQNTVELLYKKTENRINAALKK